MTIDGNQIFLYFLALVILFLTPGPVWVALIARTVSGGAKSSISLALGVSLGDMLWPFLVYFSLSLLISLYSDILLIFRYIASFVLILMGLQIIYLRNKTLSEDHRLTKSGFIAGFYAGLHRSNRKSQSITILYDATTRFFQF